jgi:hypothetical protein
MMMSQFRQETGTSGVGFALGGKGEHVYGKVGEFSGLSPSEKSSTTPKLIKINPPKPTEPTVKDEVFCNTLGVTACNNAPKHGMSIFFLCLHNV